MKIARILVTGANGFIGRNLCILLKEKGYIVRGTVHNNVSGIFGVDECIQMGNMNESTDWRKALCGVDTVIHLAARVHVMDNQAADPAEVFHGANVLGTRSLAQMAVKEGVRRVIFISSVGVNGGSTCGKPFTEDDIPNPTGAYAVSKWEAEQSLRKVAQMSGMEVVILRPPLVYGPGVKANFKNLIKLVRAGLPLPFKGINNRRSFIYIGNLADVIIACITHPLAAGETFLVSDRADVSTPDLIEMIAHAMNKKAALFSLHPGILKALCGILGKSEELEKLAGSLLVDSSKIRNLLVWKPPFTLEEGIKETVKGLGLLRRASPSSQ